MLSLDLAKYRFSRQNPFPPTDRRYQLAKACLAHGVTPSVRFDDKYTWGAFKFLRARAVFRQPKQRVAEVLMKYPELACVFKIHHGEAESFRPIVEAYLLSGDNRESIADAMRVNPQTIEWYEKVFYDVEAFRKHPMYVLTRLIGTMGKHGHGKLDEPALWKLVGYAGGPKALDQLLGSMQGIGEAQGEEGIKDWLSQRTRAMLQTKQLLAVSRLKPGDENHMEQLLRLLSQGQRAKGNPADSPLNAVEMHAKAMLNDILWAIGPKDLPPPLQEYQDKAAELRADEEMKLMAGIDLPELEEIKDLKIPLERDIPPREKPNMPPEK